MISVLQFICYCYYYARGLFLFSVKSKANYEERYKSFGIVYDTYTKKSHYIIIIHNALNKHVHIITVMYTDKGGMRASGFDKL
jgi:hypothetical protein